MQIASEIGTNLRFPVAAIRTVRKKAKEEQPLFFGAQHL